MSGAKKVLELFESQGGVHIDSSKLSRRLRERIEKLDVMLSILNHLKDGAELLNRRRRQYRLLFFFSLNFSILGMIFGVAGFLQGYLITLQATVSLSAAAGILAVGLYSARMARRLRSTYLRKSAQIEDLSLDLDANIERAYHDVVTEQSALRRSTSTGANRGETAAGNL